MLSQVIRQQSLPAKLGAGALFAASVIAGSGGCAEAASGDNPPAGLLAKIQIATQATNTTTTLSSSPGATQQASAGGGQKQVGLPP